MLTKLLLSPEEASTTIGVKRAKMFQLLTSGEIVSIKVGRLRRIPVQALEAWVARQLEQHGGSKQGGV